MATKRPCHFQDTWIVEFEQDGIDRSELGNTYVRCKLCKTDFSIMNSGRSHVTAHLRTACHTRNRSNIDTASGLNDHVVEELGGTATSSIVLMENTPSSESDALARQSVTNMESDRDAANLFAEAKNCGFDFLASSSRSSSAQRNIRRSRKRLAPVQADGEDALRDARLQLLHLQAERTRLEIEKLKNENLLVSIELENAAMKRALLRDQLQKAGHQFRFDTEVSAEDGL